MIGVCTVDVIHEVSTEVTWKFEPPAPVKRSSSRTKTPYLDLIATDDAKEPTRGILL